jgi:integrase
MAKEPQVLHVLTPEEEETLLHHFKKEDQRYNLAVLLMLTTGMRVAEVCALTISDVSQDRKPHEFIELKEHHTKGAKPRTLPVPEATRHAIYDYLQFSRHIRYYMTDTAPLLPSSRSDTPLQPRDVQRALARAALRSIKRKVNPHMLRHTYATRMAKVLPLHDLAKLLGHSDPRTTMIYYHANKQDLKDAVEQARNIESAARGKATRRRRSVAKGARRPAKRSARRAKPRSSRRGSSRTRTR